MMSRYKNDVKMVILTTCKRAILHPSCKTPFPSPGRVHGNPGRVCKKDFTFSHLSNFLLIVPNFLAQERLSSERNV